MAKKKTARSKNLNKRQVEKSTRYKKVEEIVFGSSSKKKLTKKEEALWKIIENLRNELNKCQDSLKLQLGANDLLSSDFLEATEKLKSKEQDIVNLTTMMDNLRNDRDHSLDTVNILRVRLDEMGKDLAFARKNVKVLDEALCEEVEKTKKEIEKIEKKVERYGVLEEVLLSALILLLMRTGVLDLSRAMKTIWSFMYHETDQEILEAIASDTTFIAHGELTNLLERQKLEHGASAAINALEHIFG
ncbi:hypothetical protein KW791_03010 [Candidatus Parcubacteria bacterium]|nr:hypothetical protein [Candidatus Parcubacteria bacterium]